MKFVDDDDDHDDIVYT